MKCLMKGASHTHTSPQVNKVKRLEDQTNSPQYRDELYAPVTDWIVVCSTKNKTISGSSVLINKVAPISSVLVSTHLLNTTH